MKNKINPDIVVWSGIVWAVIWGIVAVAAVNPWLIVVAFAGTIIAMANIPRC